MEYITDVIDDIKQQIPEPDPRADIYPLTESPIPNILHCMFYLFIVCYAGPKFMKNRPAYDLKFLLIPYNWALVGLSTFLFYEFLMAGWGTGDFSLLCQEPEWGNSARELRMIRVMWWFWISKHIEFLDTYFFIARKNFRQVSFLHVFHHTLMAATWYLGPKYAGGGMGTFHALINSFVHMVMYTYYGIAAMGHEYRKYLWWKKYLTSFQMAQFVAIFGHMTNIIVFYPDCKWPQIFKYIIAMYGTIFFVLFSNFWIQNYTKGGRNKPAMTGGKSKHSVHQSLSNGHLKLG